ncbi:MAG TPA: ATP-binding protein [Thermodesulfobacteriota bacterium]|nr:ATP-binding protein [Thermodesulfobacteriota bacterium]
MDGGTRLTMKWGRKWSPSLIEWSFLKRALGLKTKITFLIVLIVAGVLFLSGYLDFQLARRAHIDLYLDRNLYIAKQIDLAIPDQKMMQNLPYIHDEIEEWLLSRPSLMEIDIFLFTPKGWEVIVSNAKETVRSSLALTASQINNLKKDRHLSSLRESEAEKWLEVIVPLHVGPRVVGGIRVVSSSDEAQSYLSKKRDRTILITLSSILIILITLTLLFRKLVGNPIQKLVDAMAQAEKGDLEAEANLQSQDELGKLGRNFNQMLRRIRETHEQNIQLLSQVNQFNEDLTEKINAATSELAKRNEELKLLNEALFESQRQLGQSEKLAALGQVTATMAHQMGTPLNSISGYIQLMVREGNLPPKERERLMIIESQLDRLADSVKNLLSFTRQPKPQLRSLGVNEVLDELIHLSEPWFHARNVKISTLLSPNLSPILGDPTHLQTLFLNLITNALDAMPKGGTLTIKTRHGSGSLPSGDGEWIEIGITDTGIGITEESKKRIFEPFYTTKKLGEGTGLGLAICNQIIKEHSGRIDVESEVGKGSTFFVFIPISQGSESHESHVGPSPGRR